MNGTGRILDGLAIQARYRKHPVLQRHTAFLSVNTGVKSVLSTDRVSGYMLAACSEWRVKVEALSTCAGGPRAGACGPASGKDLSEQG